MADNPVRKSAAEIRAEAKARREERAAKREAKASAKQESADFLGQFGLANALGADMSAVDFPAAVAALKSESDPDRKKDLIVALNRFLLGQLRMQPGERAEFVANHKDCMLELINCDLDDKHGQRLKNSASSAIANAQRENSELFASDSETFFAQLQQGDMKALNTLRSLHSNEPDQFHTPDRLAIVVAAADGSKGTREALLAQQFALTVLGTAGQKDPALIAPYLDFLIAALPSNLGYLALQCIKTLAPAKSELVASRLADIVVPAKKSPQMHHLLGGVLGACVRGTDQGSALQSQAFAAIVDLLKNKKALNEHGARQCLVELRSFMEGGQMDRDVVAQHKDLVSQYVGDGGDVGTAAKEAIAVMEGRSLDSIAQRLDAVEESVLALNQKVAETCLDFEDVKRYVDENIADVKDFVGEVVKKMPVPVRFMVVGVARRSLILHFECCRGNPGCLYPADRPFTTETQEWAKWVKMGFTLVKLGKAVVDVGTGNPLGLARTGVDAVKDIYAAYKQNEDDDFNTFISQPFLMSDEQDRLLAQLRAENFFDAFEYASQQGGWACSMCMHSGGRLNDENTIQANMEVIKAEGKGEGGEGEGGEGGIPWQNKSGPVRFPPSAAQLKKRKEEVAKKAMLDPSSLPAHFSPRDKRQSIRFHVHWQPDKEASNCSLCNMRFTVVKRRHHCRACGKVFCDQCCGTRIKLQHCDKPERVCLTCVKLVSEGKRPNTSAIAALQDEEGGDAAAIPVDEWQQVWLVLEEDALGLFESEKMATEMASISLNQLRIVEKSKSLPCGIRVMSPKTEIQVEIGDEDEAAAWLAAIRRHLTLMADNNLMSLQRTNKVQ